MVVNYTDNDGNKWIFFSGSSDIYSQWYPSKFTDTIEDDDIVYSCAEQYMMSQKAKLFDDMLTNDLIMATTDPKKQKALGRKVSGFDEKVWNRHCKDIVTRGNLFKFDAIQNKSLHDILLATGDATLVEASPWDKVWGVGIGADACIRLIDAGKKLPGKNLLGECIMDVRDMLNE